MKTKYPSNKYTIVYDSPNKEFCMSNPDGNLIQTHPTSGRELGRDAWALGADEVCYNYDLGLDEHIPLIPYHERLRR